MKYANVYRSLRILGMLKLTSPHLIYSITVMMALYSSTSNPKAQKLKENKFKSLRFGGIEEDKSFDNSIFVYVNV